jgi:hypothetical protein
MQNGASTAANCFRNHMGEFQVATTIWRQPCLTILEEEAYAILNAMCVALDKGFDRVIF